MVPWNAYDDIWYYINWNGGIEMAFDQSKYNYQWQKENMKSISLKYNTEFVEAFRDACKKLGIKQSEVIRQAMLETIKKAEK